MSSASSGSAVVTQSLRKTYRTRRGKQVAVNSLDLHVPSGGVHGFLGPNGSGKTTTIRMLLGLVRPDSGSMRIFGEVVPEKLPEVVDRVGAIVESPKFFPAFTGRQNLQLLASGIGVPRKNVDRVLETVRLADRSRDRYGGYSLGMKQRLAVAATLLKDPDLLIFDEPTNGLDPAGIREIRDTMRALGDQGKTVLVSSHILAEVEQIADTVSIIGHGRLLASGPVADVIGAGSGIGLIQVSIADPDRAATIITGLGFTVERTGEDLIVRGCEDPSRLNRELSLHGMYAHGLVVQRAGLESVFLTLTAGEGLGESGTP